MNTVNDKGISRCVQVRVIKGDHDAPQSVPPLTPHQREVLQTLCAFNASDEDKLVAFSVLGMTSTGKTRLLHAAFDEIQKSGKHPVVLSPNQRLAGHSPIQQTESIYAHIYITDYEDDTKDNKDKPEKEQETTTPKSIPMKACEDDENCIYLLDHAHLLSNSKFVTPDGKQYGSGRLLDDFCKFSALGEGKRKVVFFGDPYQIQRSGDEASVLSGKFQASKGWRHRSVELTEIDPTDGSAKLTNAKRLMMAIRSGRFAELDLRKDPHFRCAEREEAAKEILNLYRDNPFSLWYLADTHDKVNSLARWVRKQLCTRQTPAPIEPRDLLEIYVSPPPPPPEQTGKGILSSMVLSGVRCLIADVAETKTNEQSLKGRVKPIIFHDILCQLTGKGMQSVHILEEFLVSEKPELSADMAIAVQVWHQTKKKEKNPSPKFTYARYGYAATVHHAQGRSAPTCYINCEHKAGRHSEGFFRWLYTALTIAEREVILINFTDIHAFDSALWNVRTVAVTDDINIGAGWTVQPDDPGRDEALDDCPAGVEQSKNRPISVAIWQRIGNAIKETEWDVKQVVSHPYQEQYELIGPDIEPCHLRIAYNGKNTVTAMHVSDQAYWSLLVEIASQCLQTISFTPEAEALLHQARSRLGITGWKIVSASESAYRLSITVARNAEERVVIEINFDKQGLVSSLRPLKTSAEGLLEQIESALR